MRHRSLLVSLESAGIKIPDVDAVHVTVPLFIRLAEWSHENAKSDQALHFMTERLTAACAGGKTVGMEVYEHITDVKLTGKN